MTVIRDLSLEGPLDNQKVPRHNKKPELNAPDLVMLASALLEREAVDHSDAFNCERTQAVGSASDR
jgi:hypothetical protein